MHLLRITTFLFALAAYCLSGAGLHAQDVVVSAKKLAEAAHILPAQQREEVRRQALAIILLSEYGRLLPANPGPLQWETLENTFLDGRIEELIRRQQADSLPPADTVSYDGARLTGGGFARIDQILGTNRRPIALDRRLPTRYIPLAAGEQIRLQQAADNFSATPAAENLRKRTNALYRVQLVTPMVGDGLFHRPYVGRTDDLFYRMVQENPSPSTELNFYAIVESLPNRQFHPLTGIGAPAVIPADRFSISETLSEGGLLAVEAFKNRNKRADVRNPFFGFAARVLPFLGTGLETTEAGEEYHVPKEAIRSAFQSPRRFTPKPVQAIFDDPSHFFSGLAPKTIFVARRLSRSRMAEEIKRIDFATPLPELADEPVGNEVLANPPNVTAGEYVQELPALLDLNSTENPEVLQSPAPVAQGLPITSELTIDSPRVAPSSATDPKTTAMETIPADGKSQPEPAAPTPQHYLAIVTPDIAASEKYLESIAVSDSFFAKNAASLQRVNCYLKWLNATLEPVEAYLHHSDSPASDQHAEIRKTAEAAQDQLAALLEQRITLQKERGKLLAERARLRTDIEGTPIRQSISRLEEILGRPTKVSGSRTTDLTYL